MFANTLDPRKEFGLHVLRLITSSRATYNNEVRTVPLADFAAGPIEVTLSHLTPDVSAQIMRARRQQEPDAARPQLVPPQAALPAVQPPPAAAQQLVNVGVSCPTLGVIQPIIVDAPAPRGEGRLSARVIAQAFFSQMFGNGMPANLVFSPALVPNFLYEARLHPIDDSLSLPIRGPLTLNINAALLTQPMIEQARVARELRFGDAARRPRSPVQQLQPVAMAPQPVGQYVGNTVRMSFQTVTGRRVYLEVPVRNGVVRSPEVRALLQQALRLPRPDFRIIAAGHRVLENPQDTFPAAEILRMNTFHVLLPLGGHKTFRWRLPLARSTWTLKS